MSIKLLVTSDIHLGRRSSGLPTSTSDASAIASWNRLTDTCLNQQIDLLLIAGDVIDRENLFFESVSPLVRGLEKLADEGIATCMVAGNHDFDILSDATRQIDSERVYLLGTDGAWERQVLDLQNGEHLQVFGRSFTRSELRTDPLQGFDIETVDPGHPSVGIVHGEVGVSESKYGPIDQSHLQDLPVNAWFIGHIHKPSLLHEDTPLICYPGSPHAFSSAEQGIHGPWMVEITPDRGFNTEQLALSPVRYETVEADISEVKDKKDFRQQVIAKLMDQTEGYGAELDSVRHLVFDVRVVGSTNQPGKIDLWSDEVVDFYEKLSTPDVRVSVRKVKTNLSPAVESLESWAKQNNPAGMLADILVKLRNDQDSKILQDLLDQWKMKIDQVNRSEVYRPIRKNKRQYSTDSEVAKKQVKKECEKLLMQLIRQQQTEESNQ